MTTMHCNRKTYHVCMIMIICKLLELHDVHYSKCMIKLHTCLIAPPVTDGGMSTDSEDDIYTTPLSTNTSREEEGEGEWEELDNPVYHTHVDHKTHEKSPQHAATTQGTLRNKTTPHLLTLPPNDMLPSSNVLSVTVPKRGRARSFEEIVAGEEKGNEPSSRRRSRSQPNEPVSLRRETQGETSGHREMTDGRVSSGLHVPDQPYSIPIKTQIGMYCFVQCIF